MAARGGAREGAGEAMPWYLIDPDLDFWKVTTLPHT